MSKTIVEKCFFNSFNCRSQKVLKSTAEQKKSLIFINFFLFAILENCLIWSYVINKALAYFWPNTEYLEKNECNHSFLDVSWVFQLLSTTSNRSHNGWEWLRWYHECSHLPLGPRKNKCFTWFLFYILKCITRLLFYTINVLLNYFLL